MEKNAKNAAFFYKEWKRMQRTLRSFIKNGKECKERHVLLKRTEKNAKTLRSFEKNGCPTLVKICSYSTANKHFAKPFLSVHMGPR